MAQTAKVAISLPQELLQECDQIADELKQTRSGLIRAAIGTMVEEYQQKKAVSAAKAVYAQIAEEDAKLNNTFLSISADTLGDFDEKSEAR